MIKKILTLFLFLILIPISYSQYYGNFEIYVENTGEVSINGITNLASMSNVVSSDEFTSKRGSVWTLNITTDEVFDNFIYELNLPKYADVNYIKTTPTFRIADENGRIQIIGTGDNKPLTLVVQYTINNTSGILIEYGLILVFLLIFFGLIFVMRFFGFKLKREKNNNKEIMKNDEEYDYTILPQRQKDIIDILKSEKKLTQKDLEEKMDIPKSSVSRNLKTLEIKGIIKKEQVGKIKYVSLR